MVQFVKMTPDEQLPHSSTTLTNKNNQSMAVIWDMDGVLVDTGGFHFQVWRDVLARYGIELTEGAFSSNLWYEQ